MDKMDRLLKNWYLMRIVRLLAGVGIAVYAISSKDYTFLLLAGLFLFQAIMNISCCGSKGCYTNKEKPKENIYRDQIKKYKPN
ncbi:hypothetical protein [Dysgonomonas sp. HDW5A]|uniref:hypothetical protein n=1 Tax=Dysgonomonas sp. HDW5A TaxID=2714926 RepID=UPI002103F973|nr:hypothetical protein [Dysgonomonas sp. HDW5A]